MIFQLTNQIKIFTNMHDPFVPYRERLFTGNVSFTLQVEC